MSGMLKPSKVLPALLLLSLIAVPAWAATSGDNFMVAFMARVLIYAIAATALNVALGFGGLVSLGHALFIGIGMYSVSLPAFYGVGAGGVHLLLCVVTCTVVGGLTGLISLRTTGIAFIMITLAFAQMGYFVIVSLKQYGGDDGMSIATASQFGAFDLGSPAAVFYAAWALLAALTYGVARLRVSPFGMTLRAGRQNARRVMSVGLALRRYQLAAYVLSAIGCGLAGMLLANLNAYASPSSMSWSVSGELIVMVVLGGMGSVFGPLVGSLTFLGAEEILKAFTEHWMAVFGLAIVVVPVLGRAGLMGLLERLDRRPGNDAKAARPAAGAKEVA